MSSQKSNIELSGKYRSTTNGHVDWYYGGGEEAYASVADALVGVPTAVRAGRTVGILTNGKLVEYVWEPDATGDNDLLEKHLSKFTSELTATLTSTESFGSLPENTLLSYYKNKAFSDIFEEALFPEKEAYIQTPNSLSLTGITESTLEVGTSVTSTLISIYTPGTIYNGDDTSVGNLTGGVTAYELKNIQGDNVINSNASASTNTFSYFTSPFPIIEGDNSWSSEIDYAAGSETYSSSYGNAGTNLSGDIALGTMIITSNIVKGRYKYWYSVGTEGSSPSSSIAIRSLGNTSLLDENRTASLSIIVPAGAASGEISIYVPNGKTIKVLDEANLGINISSEFTNTNVSVEDAGGTLVTYTKYTRITGPTGYSNPTVFNVTII
jgi:hypothetical protein